MALFVCLSVLCCYFSLTILMFTNSETDDYAEIVDEEDTYTMPSSKWHIPFLFQPHAPTKTFVIKQ